MRRVLVIGSGGAGKSTVAAEIGERLGLPVVHLDALYWRPGWTEPTKHEWERTVRQILDGEAWVMDGNYGGTLDLRLAAADAVVFLDLPRLLCLWRVVKRRFRYHGRTRPDMAAACPERLSAEFLRWIWDYPRSRRPGVLAQLESVGPGKRVAVLRSRGGVRRFLATLSSRAAEPPKSGGCHVGRFR